MLLNIFNCWIGTHDLLADHLGFQISHLHPFLMKILRKRTLQFKKKHVYLRPETSANRNVWYMVVIRTKSTFKFHISENLHLDDGCEKAEHIKKLISTI